MTIHKDESDTKTEYLNYVRGSWQCPKCYMVSGFMWAGQPNPNGGPLCCGGIEMIPYTFTTTTPKDKP